MYIERDAKILLIYRSTLGIIVFVVIYLAILSNQQFFANENFSLIQFIVFSALFSLTLILTLSSYSLKKEISKQQSFLKELKETPKDSEEKNVKIAYDKSGLYFLIIISVLGIIGLLYLYSSMVLHAPSDISFQKGTLQTFSALLFSILFILFVVLVISLKVLLEKIQTPSYFEYKVCPCCGGSDIYKVGYSWWSGLIGSNLAHQVRCKQCGKAYNGITGCDTTQKISLFLTLVILLTIILTILRLVL